MIGRQLGSYQVVSLIGSGGMGEVYQAQDTNLRRDVAIKVLPPAFTNDPEWLSRFQREARMLASLNHPNVATIHGLEQSDGVSYLVMELVPGKTLAERIKSGPIQFKEALQFARQIAEALEAAHEKGVIHRDLKPANVKVTPDGRVKVLDFGLAKAFANDGGLDLSHAPTLTAMASEEGQVLGTPSYMSPEQARGMPVDKRTDIWAFGCVFYEMLTGKQAFPGKTLSDVIAAVLEREPNWQILPLSNPVKVRDLLRRCLQKDSQRRLRDIGDARIEIEEALLSPAKELGSPSTTSPRRPWQRTTFWSLAILILAAIIGIALWNRFLMNSRAPQPVAHFLLPISGGALETNTNSAAAVALSPDGTHLAFVSTKGPTTQLYLRGIADVETKALQATDHGTQPFFSPDGQWLAFFADGKLKKIPTSGGPPVVLSDASSPRGGNWGDDGTIVFAPQSRGLGIFQVSADGGTPKQITTLDAAKGETSHRQPELLPGGKTVLFTAFGATFQDVTIMAQSLKTGERRVLIEGASFPHFAPTGHLLYVQPKLPGVVMAVAFDPVSMKISGIPAPVLEGVLTNRGDSAQWSLARSGMLVFAPGGFQEAEDNLVWVDRKGGVTPVGTPLRRPYAFPRLSPDEHRLAVSLHGVQDNLWMYDFSATTLNRLTFEGNNDWPVWTPDGKRVTYASNRSEPWRLFWKSADGSGNEETVWANRGPGDQEPYSWSPDGKLLAFSDEDPSTAQDIWVLSLDGERRAQPFLRTAASEVDASFSPDGRWLAYASNESGRFETYVQPFPGSGGKWQISTEGGREPRWSRNGRELFYRSGDRMMAVDVTTQPAFQAGATHVLFQGPYLSTPTTTPDYDVTSDGQRFLMVQPSEQRPPVTEFNVVLNWFEELKRLAPPTK